MNDQSPIRDLYAEHNGITVMLEILRAVTEKLRRGEMVHKKDLMEIVNFLTVFADQCHHGKEEGVLIPAMKQSRKKNVKFLSEIIGEHKTGRDLINGMRVSLEGYSRDTPELFHFSANAEGYVRLLTEHIRKENVILFPEADGNLGAKQKLQISHRFSIIEERIIGKGKHEAFHSLLKSLQHKYL